PIRSASVPGCSPRVPRSRWRCFPRYCWWSFFSFGISGASRTDDRRREVEEVALVLPADGSVHPRPVVPVLLDAGDHAQARRRALPAVEPSAVLAVLDLRADARSRQEPAP